MVLWLGWEVGLSRPVEQFPLVIPGACSLAIIQPEEHGGLGRYDQSLTGGWPFAYPCLDHVVISASEKSLFFPWSVARQRMSHRHAGSKAMLGPACHEGKAVLYAARRVTLTDRRLAGLLRTSELCADNARLGAGLGRKGGFRVRLTTLVPIFRTTDGREETCNLATQHASLLNLPTSVRTRPSAPDAPHLQAPCEHLQVFFSMLPHQAYLLSGRDSGRRGGDEKSVETHKTGPPTQPRADERVPDKKNAGITLTQSTRRCPIAWKHGASPNAARWRRKAIPQKSCSQGETVSSAHG